MSLNTALQPPSLAEAGEADTAAFLASSRFMAADRLIRTVDDHMSCPLARISKRSPWLIAHR